MAFFPRRQRVALRLVAASLVTLLAAVPCAAGAATVTPRVPVLVLDAGLGDAPVWLSQWLGDGSSVEAEPGSTLRLWQAKRPVWWSAGEAPSTYLLASTNETGGGVPGAISPADIAWALDKVTAKDPSLKALLVAQGAVGLQARAYLEGLGKPGYAGRADVAGLVLVGVPEQGLEMAKRYPQLDLWPAAAAGAGLEPEDLLPGSGWLGDLAARPLPPTARIAAIQGLPARVGGFESDGEVTRADSLVPTSVSDDVSTAETRSRASDIWSLTQTWAKLTTRAGATTDTVDENLVEQIGFARGYAVDPEVRADVSKLYASWFSSGRMPTTHISTRLVVDVSGSMAAAWSGTTKIDGARRAAVDFGSALKARTSLPGATPEDIGLILFSTTPQIAMPPTADPARLAGLLKSAAPHSDTDVGAALTAAIDSFASSPRAADRSILLLSDGMPTVGMDKASILTGPVAKAKAAGIKVNTIALGEVGDKDTDFLSKVAQATGGSFHQSNDLFELRRDFLRARFAGLGALAVDKELKGPQRVQLAKASPTTRRVEAAVIPDGAAVRVAVLKDGQPLPESAYSSTKADGVVLVSMKRPQPGAYELELSSAPGQRTHVFAVSDSDVFVDTSVKAMPDNSAMLMLVLLGGALVLAVVLTVTVSLRRKGGSGYRAGEGDAA